MNEIYLKQLIKNTREKSSLIVFLIGLFITFIFAFFLLISTLLKSKSSGIISPEAASITKNYQVSKGVSKGKFKSNKKFNGKYSEKKEVTIYVIKQGDSLWNIARQNYSDPFLWQKIYKLNKQIIGNNPNLIIPGTKIKLLIQ